MISSVGIMVPGINRASMNFLSNLIKIQVALCGQTHIVGRGVENYACENIYTHSMPHKASKNIIISTIKYALLQMYMSYKVKQLSSNVNTWIFFLGGEALLLPIMTCKILNKKSIIILAGSIEREGKLRSDFRYNLLRIFKSVCCNISTKIVVYSHNLISFCNVEHFHSKISIAHEHFVDIDSFSITTALPDRPPLIGYIGRLSEEKGIQQFTRALPTLLDDHRELRVLIGGDGQLKEAIATALQETGITSRVDLSGWLSHNDLPKFLNQMRLLIIPSYTEGLPNIMLEAMACGTPILATPVGAIPDIVVDGKTGFIMENNTPDCIAENVIRTLNSPDLERVAEAGRLFVEENFTFDKAVENWKRISEGI